MTRDDQPMLPISANQRALAQRYGHVPARVKGDPKPWHVGLIVWWRFIRQREVIDLCRKCGREAEPG